MQSDRDQWDAAVETPGAGLPLQALSEDFRAALASPDVRGARALVAHAAARGVAPGRLYVDVVRPALADMERSGGRTTARLAAGIGESILADLVGWLTAGERRADGRAAVISCREHGMQAVDGSLAIDFLDCDGWNVRRIAVQTPAAQVAALAREGAIELAVAVAEGAADALRLATVCTELRRLADPPLIVLCDFSQRTAGPASAPLSADAVARDPDELVDLAARKLPGPGRRRWGVRLSRSPETLSVAPTGKLDVASTRRVADVVVSRLGTFTRLILDLRDLAEIDPAGLRELSQWPDLGGLDQVELILVTRPGSPWPAAAGSVPPSWRVVDTI